MSIFGDIAKGLGSAVRGVASGIGDVLGVASGAVGDILSGPTKLIGQLGSNMLPSITLKHDVDVHGKIDIPTSFTVRTEMPDLVSAATLIRDGLVGFDIFGGALHRLIGDLEQRNSLLNFLNHMGMLIEPSDPANQLRHYQLEVTLLNTTAALQPAAAGRNNERYTVKSSVGALVSVTLNDTDILASALLAAPSTEIAVGAEVSNAQIRDERTLVITNVKAGDVNEFKVSVQDPKFKGANLPGIAGARVQVRLLRSDRYLKTTVFEGIFNGNAPTMKSASIMFFDQHPKYSPTPIHSNKTKEAQGHVQSIIATYQVPNVPSQPGGATNAVDLLQKTLLTAAWQRNTASQNLEDTLASLDSGDPNAFDVRTPFFLNLHATGGMVTVDQVVVRHVNPNEDVFALTDAQIGDGDEISVRLPLRAGAAIPRAEIRDQLVLVFLTKAKSQGTATAAVVGGFEWINRVLSQQRIDAVDKSGELLPFTFNIQLTDALAP